MKNINGFIFFVLILIITSCNSTDFTNPEEVMKQYRKLLHEHNYVKIYDEFISTKSKELVGKDEFLKYNSDQKKLQLIDQNIESMEVGLKSSSFRRFRVKETTKINEDTTHFLNYYTLFLEDGKWKIIWLFSLANQAHINTSKGNYNESIKVLNEIVEIDPFDGSSYGNLVWAYGLDESISKESRQNIMQKNVKIAIELESDEPLHYNTYATYYQFIGNTDLATYYFEKGLEYCTNLKDKITFYDNLASHNISQKKFKKAEEYIKNSLKIDENDPFIWLQYGLLYSEQDKNKEAVSYFEIAIEKNEKAKNTEKLTISNQASLYYEIGGCLYVLNQDKRAKEYLIQALALTPNDSRIQGLLGLVD